MNYSKYNDKKKFHKKILALIIVVLVVALLSTGMYIFLESDTGSSNKVKQEDIVKIGGVSCTPKSNIKTYLFMGVDQKGELTKVKEFDGTGQCDVIQLVVVDETNKTYKTLVINRDTMVHMVIYDETGYAIGEMEGQIALAHANGDVAVFGSKVARDTVSEFLYNQKIDGYVSLNMDAIPVLNNLAGGVTVTITDDFSKSDKSLKMGETVTLTDEQSYHYVHDRKTVADGSNENRMARQEIFLDELKKSYKEKFEADNNFVNEAYNSVEKYMNTDISLSRMSNLALKLSEYTEEEGPVLEGESKIGEEGWIEFRVNQDSLDSAVRELFYDEVKD